MTDSLSYTIEQLTIEHTHTHTHTHARTNTHRLIFTPQSGVVHESAGQCPSTSIAHVITTAHKRTRNTCSMYFFTNTSVTYVSSLASTDLYNVGPFCNPPISLPIHPHQTPPPAPPPLAPPPHLTSSSTTVRLVRKASSTGIMWSFSRESARLRCCRGQLLLPNMLHRAPSSS